MENHLKRIFRLNLLSIALQVIYSAYLVRVIFILYKENADKIMAGIFIPIASLLIISLFVSSINTMRRGLYERNVQKAGAIFFITFTALTDVLIIAAFGSFFWLGKLVFIAVNIIAAMHGYRYVNRFLLTRSRN
jgi:hypothetical protein